MKAVKCPSCQFVGFAVDDKCKSCGGSLELSMPSVAPPAKISYLANAPRKSRKKVIGVSVLAGILLIIGGGYAAKLKLNQYFDPTPAYVAAITSAEDFKRPVTIRVNRREIPSRWDSRFATLSGNAKPGTAVKAADVLEALGLLTKSIDITVRTTRVENHFFSPNYDRYGHQIGGRPVTQERLYNQESEQLGINLTEKGRLEAVNWKETDEPYQGLGSEGTLPWWRIPIGDHELIRIESVKPGSAGDGRETVLVSFRWRWRPNKLGENFDPQSTGYQLLSNATQQAASTLKWDSRTEYVGHATLLKRPDKWEVTNLKFMNEESGKSIFDDLSSRFDDLSSRGK